MVAKLQRISAGIFVARKFLLVGLLHFFIGLSALPVAMAESFAKPSLKEIETACGEGVQANLDEFPAERIERCLRARGFDLFNSQGVNEHADFRCELAIWTDSGVTHAESDKFCKKVADAHEAIYGYRPYWEACGHPETVTDQDLKTCARGFFRQYDQWERPSADIYQNEPNCNSALAVYANGYSNGHIHFDGTRQEVRLARQAVGCERMRRAIASLVPYEASPCYADKLFYKDRLGFFRRCMGGDVQAEKTCQQMRQLYVDKLIAANGGLPHNLTPYDQQIPVCSEIIAIRGQPFNEATVAAAGSTDRPRSDGQSPAEEAGIQSSDTMRSSKSNFDGKFTIFLLIIIVISLFPYFLYVLVVVKPAKLLRRIGVFLRRLEFQFFHSTSIIAGFVAIIVPILWLLFTIILSFFIPYGIALWMGLDKPVSSALFANFLVVTLSVALRLFLGLKAEVRLKAAYESAVAKLTMGEELGKKLFAEAISRNFIMFFVLALSSLSAASSAATYIGITAIFTDGDADLTWGTYSQHLMYFGNLIFQMLTLEIPATFGIEFGPRSLPGSAIALRA